MISAFRHAGIVVTNMEKSIDWYRKLGFKVLSREIEDWEGVEIEVCKMTPCLELIRGVWEPHVSIGYYGPAPIAPIRSKHTRYGDVYFITDPDGNIIELFKSKMED